MRAASESDCATIHTFIRELAEYERLLHEVTGTEADLRESLFGAGARAEVVIAEEDGVAVGYALFFHNFSTFLCRQGLYLEDLYVRPGHRGKGYGRKLLGHLAALAVARGCGRMEWAVLDWNETAAEFYRAAGAREVDGWTVFRLAGRSLEELAAGA